MKDKEYLIQISESFYTDKLFPYLLNSVDKTILI